MIYIFKVEKINTHDNSNSKDKKESQYLLKVIYDSEDTKVHKLLEGIFGPDQMLEVKNGKTAKISSSFTPKERESFFDVVSQAVDRIMEQKKQENSKDNIEDSNLVETNKETNEKLDLDETAIKNNKKLDLDQIDINNKEKSSMDDINNEKEDKSDSDGNLREDDELQNIIIERITPEWHESHKEKIEEQNKIEDDIQDEIKSEEKENKDFRKVSAEKLIQEFASFLNSIS